MPIRRLSGFGTRRAGLGFLHDPESHLENPPDYPADAATMRADDGSAEWRFSATPGGRSTAHELLYQTHWFLQF